MGYVFGDMIPVPFPFTDQSTTKQRPTVTISSSGYNSQRPDLILLAIKRQVRDSLSFGEARVAEWQSAGLIKPFVFKPFVTTIELSLVIRRLGRRSDNDAAALHTVIQRIVRRTMRAKGKRQALTALPVEISVERPVHDCRVAVVTTVQSD